MPTRANAPKFCTSVCPDSRSWTDDIPVCKESGIGLSTNQLYRDDGHRQEDHPFEDQSFHFKYDDETYMYGVFDGHDGVQIAKFALDNIVAEVLLGQLDDKCSNEEVKQILRQAFLTVERNYLNAISDKLAERTSLQMEIPDGLTPYEVYEQYPELVSRLNSLNTELSSGLTAVAALIYKSRLYVANVGDCRALLCRTDENSVLRVLQLSVDHDLTNEDELLRLSLLGLNTEQLKNGSCLGNQEYTRCLGNYLIKGAYKEFEDLAPATSEPVIAVADITGGIELDESCRFLMLMSDGLYKSLEEATATENVNKDLAQMVVEQFRVQSTLTGVAQAVVDKVVRIHHDVYMSRTSADRMSVSQRDDITLVIRNFNFPMPNAKPPVPGPHITVVLPTPSGFYNPVRKLSQNSPKTTVTESSEETTDSRSVHSNSELLSNDRIKPYVDFSQYYANVEKAKMEGTLPEGTVQFF